MSYLETDKKYAQKLKLKLCLENWFG